MKTLVAATLVTAGMLTFAQAQDGNGGGRNRDGNRGCPEVRETHQANRSARREHMKQQRTENKAFRKELKDVPAEERIDRVIAHRTTQHNENKALHERLFNALIDAIRACEDMPEERKQEVVARLTKRHNEAVAFHDSIQQDVIAFLNELKASDAPPEEKKEAWQTFREEIRARLEAWREAHQREGEGQRAAKGRVGRGRGNRPDHMGPIDDDVDIF